MSEFIDSWRTMEIALEHVDAFIARKIFMFQGIKKSNDRLKKSTIWGYGRIERPTSPKFSLQTIQSGDVVLRVPKGESYH